MTLLHHNLSLCDTTPPQFVIVWHYSTISTRQLLLILSGAPSQMIVRWLSDACQMPHQTPVNSNQTSVRQVPHLHQTYTIHLTDIWWMSGICLVDVWCTYGTVYVWWAYGTCLVYVWYLSDRCLVGVDRCLVGHLTGIWQSSGDHLTRSTRQIATIWRKRWCTGDWSVKSPKELHFNMKVIVRSASCEVKWGKVLYFRLCASTFYKELISKVILLRKSLVG